MELNLPPSLLQALETLTILPMNAEIIRKADGKWVAKSSLPLSQPLLKLGPFGVKRAKMILTFPKREEETGIYRVDLRNKLSILAEWILNTGTHSPISKLPLSEQAKEAQGIPASATHFCWCYSPTGMDDLTDERKAYIDKVLKAYDPEFTFLAFGGFAYLTDTPNGYQPVRCTALMYGGTGLGFGPPETWRPEFTSVLYRQGRFQSITIQSLRDLGVQYYCYINPNEELRSESGLETWTPCPNGGFVYLYNIDGSAHPLDRFFAASASLESPPSPNPLTLSGSGTNFPTIARFATSKKPPVTCPGPSRDPSAESAAASSSSSVPPVAPSQPHRVREEYMCVICLDQPVNILVIPCMHLCMCAACASAVRDTHRCPICRGETRELQKVFF